MHHTPPCKFFHHKDNQKIKGHIYEKLNAVVSTRILYSECHDIFKSSAITL